MNMIKKGIYRHYKGYTYQVIDSARHSETLEDMVVYRALYGEHELWVRPLAMFLENVEIDGKLQKRFELID
ncbi:MAG TPA: DUF1653 domain-containing protein [Candidatus Babeliales bacterium]|nr:DUF1653 domain-containing protein [Candidatus Babeliales bacterium]